MYKRQGKKLNTGDLAIKIVMPQDADYAAEVSKKVTANYLIVDYKDVYDDENKNVITERGAGAVSYTHLTLPTSDLV